MAADISNCYNAASSHTTLITKLRVCSNHVRRLPLPLPAATFTTTDLSIDRDGAGCLEKAAVVGFHRLLSYNFGDNEDQEKVSGITGGAAVACWEGIREGQGQGWDEDEQLPGPAVDAAAAPLLLHTGTVDGQEPILASCAHPTRRRRPSLNAASLPRSLNKRF